MKNILERIEERIIDAFRTSFGLPTQKEADNLKKQAKEMQKRDEDYLREQAAVSKIKNYPEKKFSPEEFNQLPGANGESVSTEFLRTCPIGTWFVCKQNRFTDIKVVGQIVDGDDLLCDQWGAGLSVPERGINRYKAVIS